MQREREREPSMIHGGKLTRLKLLSAKKRNYRRDRGVAECSTL